MKDIKAILEEFELDDEIKQSITKAVNENYKTVNEWKKKNDRISELEEQNKTLTEQVGNLEGEGEELEKLRKQIDEFTEAEKKRKHDEEENAARESFKSVFDAAVGEREFSNSVIKDAIFEKAYAKCKESSGLGASEVIDDLTKDQDGIWVNPQHNIKMMPSPSDMASGGSNDAQKVKDSIAITDFLYPKK